MSSILPTPENLTLAQIMKRFSTEETAIAYLEAIRWPNGIACPHCGNQDQTKFWEIKGDAAKRIRAGLRQCAECKKQFRVTVGTIFEDSHIPLNLWLVAWYIMSGAKKGISAKQMQRHLGLGSYKSAWFLCHRIRECMKDPVFSDKLSGTVEVDETYVGGKKRGVGGQWIHLKTPVVSLVERDGRKRSFVIERVTGASLKQAVREHVLICSDVFTDEHAGYIGLSPKFEHKSVKHSVKEYGRREGDRNIHTNTVESSFSLLKRGVVGSFHHVSKKHLHRYLAEFDFRWNHRKTSDGERTVAGLQKTVGKRLTYKPLKKERKSPQR